MAGEGKIQSKQTPYLTIVLLVWGILPTLIYCQPKADGTLHYQKHIASDRYNAHQVQLGIKNASMIDVKYKITFLSEKCCPVFMFGFCGRCITHYMNHCYPNVVDDEAIFLPYFIDMNLEIKKPGCQFYTDNSSYVCEGTRKLVEAAPRPWNLDINYICGKTKSIDVTLDLELTYYTHAISKCMPLPNLTCKNAVSYKQMAFPNVLGQTDENAVASLFALSMMMKESDDCYQHFTKFICYTLYPECNHGQVIYPCMQMCHDFENACAGDLYHVKPCRAVFPSSEDHVKCFYRPVECPKLKPPTSGSVTSDGYSPFNVSRYACNQGYTLHDGNETRQCMYSGLWNGSEPICSKSSNPMVPAIISSLIIILVIIVGVIVCERRKIQKLLQRPHDTYTEIM